MPGLTESVTDKEAVAATRALARYGVASRYDKLPAAVVHEAARAIVNWAGCAIGASAHQTVENAWSAMRPFAGNAQATLLGRRERTDILNAALVNEKSPREVIKDSVEDAGRAVGLELERFLNTLGTIATISTLLGLFGTIVGMIEIFGSQNPASGAGNPALLAHGISVALYNTAFGLIVAIPSLMMYRYFRGVVDAYTVDMEQAADRMVPHLMRFTSHRQ